MAGNASQQFAGMYKDIEAELNKVLEAAAKQAVPKLPKNGLGWGKLVGHAQKVATQKALKAAIGHIGEAELKLLKQGRIDAAKLSAKVMHDAEYSMLSQVFKADELAAMLHAEQLRAAAGIEAAMRRVSGESYIPLSDQVYKTNALAKGWVDKAINVGLAQGLSYTELAARVRSMISPTVPGGVSYASKRLARTEINNAFHASNIARMQRPWVESVKWNLSGSHSDPDICNDYAQSDNEGIGEGLWPVGKVPNKPHPQCLCFITPVLPSDDQFVANYQGGKYDDWLDENFPDLALSSVEKAAQKAVIDVTPLKKPANLTAKPPDVAGSIPKKAAPPKKPVPAADATATPATSTTSPVMSTATKPTVPAKLREWQPLSTTERIDINWYMQDGYAQVNSALRSASLDKNLAETVKRIDKSMENSPYLPDLTVYRGIYERNMDKNVIDQLRSMAVGDTFKDPAFVSTSLDRTVAENFTWGRGDSILMTINVPQGTSGLYLAGDQMEVLLERDLTFRVKSIQVNAKGQLQIEVDVVGEVVAPAVDNLAQVTIQANGLPDLAASRLLSPESLDAGYDRGLSQAFDRSNSINMNRPTGKTNDKAVSAKRNTVIDIDAKLEEYGTDAYEILSAAFEPDDVVSAFEGTSVWVRSKSAPQPEWRLLPQEFKTAEDAAKYVADTQKIYGYPSDVIQGGDPGLVMDLRRQAISKVIQRWAATSGDTHEEAIAVQHIANRIFNLGSKMEHIFDRLSPNQVASINEWLTDEVFVGGTEAILRAQYELTQQWLADNGITEVRVFRGMHVDDSLIPDDVRQAYGKGLAYDIDMDLQSLSSFSIAYRTADQFVGYHTGSGSTGIILSAKIPARNILSTPFTGFGCLDESEIVAVSNGGKFNIISMGN